MTPDRMVILASWQPIPSAIPLRSARRLAVVVGIPRRRTPSRVIGYLGVKPSLRSTWSVRRRSSVVSSPTLFSKMEVGAQFPVLAFSVLLTEPLQISSTAYLVRSNLNPSEVSVLLCFPLSDCFPAIDVSRSLSHSLPLGCLVTPRLYRTYAFYPCPFLCILVDVLFYSNTHLRVSLLYHHLCRAIVFTCWIDSPFERSIGHRFSRGLSCPQSYEILEPRTNGPCTPSTSMFGSPLSTISTSIVVRVCERQ